MKRSSLSALFLSFTSLLLSLNLYAAEETFTLDPAHSYVEWHISHFGFSSPSGKWMANGTLTLDKDKPQVSKANITIKVSDFITGNDDLNKHLSGKVFFDVAEFPTATFISNKVTITGKDTAKVPGILTVHGISKPITLDVKLNKTGVNPINDKPTVGFTAHTIIKRSDFGLNTLLPGLGNEVKLDIEVEANKNP